MPINKISILKNNDYRKSRKTIINIFIIVLIATYMSYHILNGNRGIFALFDIKKSVETNRVKLEEIEKNKELLSKRIFFLRPNNLDIDILEERAKAVLNMICEDEVVVDVKEVLQSTNTNKVK